MSEPHVGDVSYFRIWSGTVKNGADLYNAPREVAEKLNHLSISQGKDRTEVLELHAGDIGAVAKLKDTHTNDTLSTRETPVVLAKVPFPEPLIVLAVEVKQRGEEDKLSTALHRLHEEDPTFHHEFNAELGYPTGPPQAIRPGVYVRYFDNGAVIANGSASNSS